MTPFGLLQRVAAALALSCALWPAHAADDPAPKEADWIARDFRFHTREVLPELRLHYTTVGAPTGEPVLILHGTAASGTGMLNPAFAWLQPGRAGRGQVRQPCSTGDVLATDSTRLGLKKRLTQKPLAASAAD